MTRTLLITRPLGEAEQTAAAAQAEGWDTLLAPLLEIRPLDFAAPETQPEALLFTSPQAPPLVAGIALLAGVPAYAVGQRTARSAIDAGFQVAAVGDADATAIVALLTAAGHRRILHPCGAHLAAMAAPAELAIEQLPVYRAETIDRLPEAASEALAASRVFATLLFSPRTARCFAAALEAAGLPGSAQRIVCLSRAVADAATPGWAAVAIAAAPSAAAAFAAADQLWQESAHDRATA